MPQENTSGSRYPAAEGDTLRFVEEFGLDGLEQYVRRLKIKPADSSKYGSAEHEAIREEMSSILQKRGASAEHAAILVDESLKTALILGCDMLCHQQQRQSIRSMKKDVHHLVVALRSAANAIDALPPRSKGALNELLEDINWHEFDTETFNTIVDTITQPLDHISPKCKVEVVQREFVESRRTPKNSCTQFAARTAPPFTRELWEALPVCRQVEAQLRQQTAASERKSLPRFLRYVADLLVTQDFVIPRFNFFRAYLNRLWAITQKYQLTHTPGFDWRHGVELEREFQSFALYATEAIGACRMVSRRQMRALLAEQPKHGEPA